MVIEFYVAIVVASIAVAGTFLSIRYRNNHEARVVNKGILAEIHRLLYVIQSHKGYWDVWRIKKITANFPLIPFTTEVYREQSKHIGTIRIELIVKVVRFYGYIHYLNSLQSVRAKYKSSDTFDEQYSNSLQTLLEDYLLNDTFSDAFTEFGLDPLPLPPEPPTKVTQQGAKPDVNVSVES